LTKLKFYSDSVPLFTRYQIESQIEKAFSRDVRLPAGGGLVFEPTEAMITIDINSARSTGGQDIEETALHTNLEAADEVATQMRLRDVGGLIVIDFIDMMNPKNQRAVENRLREAVKLDRARVQIGRISRFGLLEMSRQRLRPSLTEFSHTLCPRCEGVGTIRSTRSTALALLRVLEEESMKDSTAKVIAQAPVDAATFLLNEKRQDIANIEERQNIQVLLIPNQNLETPHFEIQRIRAQDTDITEAVESYSLVTEVESPAVDNGAAVEKARDKEVAAVQPIVHTAPKPPAREEAAAPGPGFFQRLFGSLLGGAKVAPAAEQPKPQPAKRDSRSRDDNRRRRSGGGDKRSGNSQRNRQQRPKASDDSASEQAASGSSEQPGREKRSSRSRRGRGSRGGRRRSGGQNNQNEGKADEQSAGSAGNNAGDKGQGDRSGNGLGSDQRGARDDTRGNKQDSDAGDIQSKGQGGSQGAVQANSQAGSQNKAAGETAKEASASVPRHENAPPAASKSDAPRPAESPAAPPAPAAAGGGGSASRPSDTAPAPVQSNDQAGG
ncbi:MAG: ribonuclease E/G, partial [Gammaproteobacteria bacterium]|nr:ribonuclease E/G [Gammaproteobacteria bacterium]